MDLITTAEAAQILRTDPATLRYWRYMDTGPRSFRMGRRVMYQREDINSWLLSQIAATARGGVA
ncbi:helix-turn-helix transcriptional regulator [Mycobacterium shigaense]|uniref:helix-turn-helix transcriptional regulator n=1 Tax=Mycobacterium shigaense TaxID=722731 RepID=UPI0032AEB01D